MGELRRNGGKPDILSNEEVLCQFILDPTSLTLTNRVSLSDPLVNESYKFSREYYYLIDKTRIGLFYKMQDEHSKTQDNPSSLYKCDNILGKIYSN